MTLRIPPELQLAEHGSFELRRVSTAQHVAEWLIPFMEAFEIPSICRPYLQSAFAPTAETKNHPFRHFLLYENGRPITAGSIQFRYGVAVLYNITTIPEARNRGGASAMIRFLQEEARREGYSSVSLFATAAGRRVYERLGFVANGTGFQIYKLEESLF
jgi:GNAT superfamily N-acetyltransferase